jgi:hypothetical protein
MTENPLDADSIDAIFRSDRAEQQRRREEDAEIERQGRRSEELHAAFAAVCRFSAIVFDAEGYQIGTLTDQEFSEKWADLWIALGEQLRDKREFLTRQPEDLRDEQDDAPRTIALVVLKAAVQGDKAKVVNLFQRLTTASVELVTPVNEWLRHRLERLIMGYWTVGDGDQPEREGWESDDDWQAFLNRVKVPEPPEGTTSSEPAIPALPAGNFSHEKLDPSRCPGCKAPVLEEYTTLPRVPCLACGRWELHTGLSVAPVAGPPGTPPEVLQLTSPFWQARLPDRLDDQQGREDAEKKGPGDGAGVQAVGREEQIRQMESAVRLAYLAFDYAESKAGKRLEDREAYDLIKEEGILEGAGDRGELEDYNLPAFDTWARYVRQARQVLDEQKYTRRAGRRAGKSIVKSNQIEHRKANEM